MKSKDTLKDRVEAFRKMREAAKNIGKAMKEKEKTPVKKT